MDEIADESGRFNNCDSVSTIFVTDCGTPSFAIWNEGTIFSKLYILP